MLAERYPSVFIAESLTSFDGYRPYPSSDDRRSWDSLPAGLREVAIQRGEELLECEWPMLTAVRYMDFARDGNRSRYEELYFRRRNMLGRLALAECVENKGRFIDQIINGVWCICEESSWVVPAHNSHSGTRQPLPSESDVNCDLFAADTGATLSWIHHLLGSRLDAVSPVITERIRTEVERRVLAPFMAASLHWMGFHDRPVNNWNPWCTSNCLAAMLLIERGQERRTAAVERSLRILDNWLRGYAPDGGCDEGPGYWNVAGGALFDCLELIHGATGGRVSFYDEPLIGEIGRYISRVHISEDYFVNFADGSARLAADGCMIYRYGSRIGDSDMVAMGTSVYRTSKTVLKGSLWHSFTRVLPEVFAWEEMSRSDAEAPYPRDSWMADIQVMAARERAGSDKGLYLAAKGGHNNESHNHNDVGSFIVYANGRPMLIDAGVGAYTRDTFSPNRYKIWTMQSAYHNLPTINGVTQAPGRQFAASDVSYHSDDTLAELSLSIAGAYPEEAGIEKWQRTCRLHRGAEAFVEVVDEFAMREPTSDITLSLLAAQEPEAGVGKLTIRDSEGVGVSVEYEAAHLAAEVETLQLDDERLSSVVGPNLYKVTLRSRNPVGQGTWRTCVRML